MDGEKWIGRSRRLWAVALTALAGGAEALGYDLSELLPLVEQAGNQVIALAATGLALWSRLTPDQVVFRAKPRVLPEDG